jgi:alkylation response protein AidB-like acyl-CoA dehydrogenase
VFIPDVQTDTHKDLRATVRALVERSSAAPRIREVVDTDPGYDPALWRVMAEDIGLQGVAIPEEYGGAGGDLADLVVVQQELGRGVVPSPYLSSAGFAAPLLLALGDEKACAAHLPGIAAGTTVATVAVCDKDGSWQVTAGSVRAQHDGERWSLSGERWYVLDGLAADLLLVPVRDDDGGLSVFAVEVANTIRTALETLDPTRRQAVVVFDDAPAQLVGEAGAAAAAYDTAWRTALLALVAEQAGGAEFLMGLSLDYAKLRHQFGRPIGSFQAVKHKLADMAFDLERMKSVVTQLSADVVAGRPQAAVVAHLAKAFCSEAYFRIAAENIQIHGGIGFTWEHVSHLYFRRAKSTEYLLGSPAAHREQMITLLGV